MQHRITGPGDISGRSLSLQELDQQDQKSDSMTETGAGDNLPESTDRLLDKRSCWSRTLAHNSYRNTVVETAE